MDATGRSRGVRTRLRPSSWFARTGWAGVLGAATAAAMVTAVVGGSLSTGSAPFGVSGDDLAAVCDDLTTPYAVSYVHPADEDGSGDEVAGELLDDDDCSYGGGGGGCGSCGSTTTSTTSTTSTTTTTAPEETTTTTAPEETTNTTAPEETTTTTAPEDEDPCENCGGSTTTTTVPNTTTGTTTTTTTTTIPIDDDEQVCESCDGGPTETGTTTTTAPPSDEGDGDDELVTDDPVTDDEPTAGAVRPTVKAKAPKVLRQKARVAVIVVRLSKSVAKKATLRYRTANGSARAGKDFKAKSGKVVFKPGTKTVKIRVPLIDAEATRKGVKSARAKAKRFAVKFSKASGVRLETKKVTVRLVR